MSEPDLPVVALGDLEGSAVSFADLVQLILERVDLPFHLLKGQAVRSDEQAAILSRAQRSRAIFTPARPPLASLASGDSQIIWCAGCDDDREICRPTATNPTAMHPVEGGVYTIRSFSVGENELGLRLAEIINPTYDFEDEGIGEVAFLSYRFRPAKETSLEVFDAALKGQPLRVEER